MALEESICRDPNTLQVCSVVHWRALFAVFPDSQRPVTSPAARSRTEELPSSSTRSSPTQTRTSLSVYLSLCLCLSPYLCLYLSLSVSPLVAESDRQVLTFHCLAVLPLPGIPVSSPQDEERASASMSYFGQLHHHTRK